jgi:hypothetical protein
MVDWLLDGLIQHAMGERTHQEIVRGKVVCITGHWSNLYAAGLPEIIRSCVLSRRSSVAASAIARCITGSRIKATILQMDCCTKIAFCVRVLARVERPISAIINTKKEADDS